MAQLTHVDARGNARMVEVGGKEVTARRAVAEGYVRMGAEARAVITERRAKKGDVLLIAQIAGIQAAKRTSDLIPLCHPLALSKVVVELTPDDSLPGVRVRALAKLTGKTGVEMEALTAASVAALTVYDMCKAIDRAMRIGDIRLAHKSGGKSGTYEAAE